VIKKGNEQKVTKMVQSKINNSIKKSKINKDTQPAKVNKTTTNEKVVIKKGNEKVTKMVLHSKINNPIKKSKINNDIVTKNLPLKKQIIRQEIEKHDSNKLNKNDSDLTSIVKVLSHNQKCINKLSKKQTMDVKNGGIKEDENRPQSRYQYHHHQNPLFWVLIKKLLTNVNF